MSEVQTENEIRPSNVEEEKNEVKKRKKTVENGPSKISFLYDPRRKTVLGRDAMNWAKLSAFYTVFFFCLGCFFVSMLYGFTFLLDRQQPTYFDGASTMAVRTTATVVGMGFRPQPEIDDNVIRISDKKYEQERLASSLRLFRDVFLLQKNNGRVEKCSPNRASDDLEPDTACAFNWFDIVPNQNHPCSDNNYYGFKTQEPCVLVKINKVYGWMPKNGPLPLKIQELKGISNNDTVKDPDVFVTCGATNPVDQDALNGAIIYYSLGNPEGSTKFGVVPNYFFPYRNAKNHVQPFVLVQFKGLPANRLISITCRLWAPGIEHDTRGMRGMVNFQLFKMSSIVETDFAKENKETQISTDPAEI